MPAVERIGVGQMGAGFIGQVHSLAYRGAAAARRRVGADVDLVVLADRDLALAREVADRYGWRAVVDDWRAIVDDDRVQLVDVAGPNHVHVEPCLAAARAGKHLLCEKPLAPTAAQALELWRAVEAARVLHQCAFMYRFIPAVQHARDLVRSGELGEVLHVRAQFLLSFALDPRVEMSWRFDRAVAGAGALGDLGSHHVDVARFVLGEEVAAVTGRVSTSIDERPGGRVTNDDAFAAIVELEGGATAVLEGSRVAGNHGLTSRVEIDGTRGSLRFDFERLNELTVSLRGQPGARTYLVSQAEHPYSDFWLPVGIQGQHPIGWADCFAHQAHAMVTAIAAGTALPDGVPTFRDGYRVAQVVETIERAAAERTWLPVAYEDATPAAVAPVPAGA
ncbi:Gfo/Idh/MocA family protein [Patulibacter defluvii]|uniref:Gfo/Idh/MocA family protein n=1 Tax=Patulibacter defluvii TaxID=3095358 RepID=UPI002A74B735|nr:Gfo/Idh/MocA family oxidoreductase [Patulibacter sp. DM4]